MDINKFKFKSRSQKGCSNSYYILMRTNCCGRVGVEDVELSEFYFDAKEPDRSVNLFEELTCPYCDSGSWDTKDVDPREEVPGEWVWAR